MSKRASILVTVLLLAASAALSGCQKPLFPPNAARTPYERYMVLRGQYRPASEPGPYGGDKPSLRQRLRPLGSQ